MGDFNIYVKEVLQHQNNNSNNIAHIANVCWYYAESSQQPVQR